MLSDPTTNRFHSWDTASFRYKIDSSMSAPDLDELDEYAFVVRTRIGKNDAGGSRVDR